MTLPMARLFIAQSRIDSWSDEGKLTFTGDRLILSELDRSFKIEPASRFLCVVGAEIDPHQLVNKVISDARLAEMGAESLSTSVIYGEVAYDVEPGFLGVPE